MIKSPATSRGNNENGVNMFVIIAQGPNDVQMPVILAETREDAEKYVADAGIDLDNSRGEKLYDGREVYQALELGKGDFNLSALAAKFFTEYYSGCGEAYRFHIQEVPLLTPFVGWNLD